MTNPYKILQVDPNASAKEIKKAYNRLILSYHPDVLPQEKKAKGQKKMIEITEAFSIIGNEKNRIEFDSRQMYKKEEMLRKRRKEEYYHEIPHYFDNDNLKKRKMFNNEDRWNDKRSNFDKIPPKIVHLRVSLDEIYTGIIKEVNVTSFCDKYYDLIPFRFKIEPGSPDGSIYYFNGCGPEVQDVKFVIEIEKGGFERINNDLYYEMYLEYSDLNREYFRDLVLPGGRNFRLWKKYFTEIGKPVIFVGMGMPLYENPLVNGDLIVKLLMKLK